MQSLFLVNITDPVEIFQQDIYKILMEKTQSLLWEIEPDNPEERTKISFKVYEDVVNGVDRDVFKDTRIVNGQRTEYIDERKIYFHSPQGASAPFTVKITGIDTSFKK